MKACLDSEKDLASNINSEQAMQIWSQDVCSGRQQILLLSFSKIYAGKGTHTRCLPTPTETILHLIQSISGRNRNISTEN